VDEFAGGGVEVEDEQGHGDGEDSVTEGGEALEVLGGDAVVEGIHWAEFRWEGERGQEGAASSGLHILCIYMLRDLFWLPKHADLKDAFACLTKAAQPPQRDSQPVLRTTGSPYPSF
jgi:hypothetical protein